MMNKQIIKTKYNPEIHHRRSIRIPGYDYSQTGWYYATICTGHMERLFGDVVNGKMVLNEMGRIVETEWIKTTILRHNIKLDEYIIMPNHFHGIINIVEDVNRRGTERRAPTTEQFGKPVTNSIPTIIRSFKSAVTKKINEIRNTPGAILWRRNFYEHIIRDENDLNRIRQYIMNNPLKWADDDYFKEGKS
jgi:REP element-mobilizing transposase RayT